MNKQLDAASDKAYISTLSRYMATLGDEMIIVARYLKVKEKYDATILYQSTVPIKYLRNISYFLAIAFKSAYIVAKYKPRVVAVDRPLMVFSILPVLVYRKFVCKPNRFFVVLDVRSLPNRVGSGIVGQLNLIFFNLGLQIAGRYFDGCMAITPAMSSYISQNSSFEVEKIGIWSSAFDDEIFDPKLAGKSDAMKSIASPCIIYHGAIANNRMLMELVEAISLTKTKVNLFVLGGGPLLPRLHKLVAQLGLQNRVTFHPPVSYYDVPPFLKVATIGIVPIPDTLWFQVSMPIKLLEYMAMDLPVIAPHTEPVKNVMQGENCNIECFNPQGDIANNIAKAIDNLLEQLGHGEKTLLNRVHVLSRFSWRTQSEAIHNYLVGVVK